MAKAGGIVLSGIEDALALILDCSNDQDKIETALLPALKKLCAPPKSSNKSASSHQRAQPSEEMLCHPVQDDVDPLSMLDPTVHSLGMLYILAARVHHVSNDTPQYAASIFPHINAFAHRFTLSQVQLAVDKLTQLAAGVARITQSIEDPNAGLEILRLLFDRFVTQPNNLTTLHPILAYQYLRTQKYAEATTALLDTSVIDADTSVSPLKSSDVLEYFYYAGLIYTKLERYSDAIDAFETCVSSPAQAVSAIHMDAYKKLVLVQLIAHGKTAPVPSYTSSVIARTFRQVAQPYLALLTAYEADNSAESNTADLHKLVQAKIETFQQDRNWGLVQKAVSQYRQRRIQRLADVYSEISVADIAKLIGTDEQTVLDDLQFIQSCAWMYDSRRIAHFVATPGQPATVHFSTALASGQTFDSQESALLLEQKIREAQYWHSLVEARDRITGQSTTYLSRAIKTRDQRFASGPQFGGASGANYFSQSSGPGDEFDEGDDDDANYF